MRRLIGLIIALAAAGAASRAAAVTVTFDDLTTGTNYNVSDVFNSNGVDVTVVTSSGGGGAVNIPTATVIGSGNVAGVFGDRLLSFDVPLSTSFSSFEFATFGGISTLVVNGSSAALPTSGAFALGGTNVVVTSTGTDQADVTIDGPIATLVIGGDEFNLDNVLMVPEPSALLLAASGLAILALRRRRARKPRRT